MTNEQRDEKLAALAEFNGTRLREPGRTVTEWKVIREKNVGRDLNRDEITALVQEAIAPRLAALERQNEGLRRTLGLSTPAEMRETWDAASDIFIGPRPDKNAGQKQREAHELARQVMEHGRGAYREAVREGWIREGVR